MSPPETGTPPRSRASSVKSRKGLGTPRIPAPVLPRTTSQLSNVSVETRNHSSSPRKLLSKTYETGASTSSAPKLSVHAPNDIDNGGPDDAGELAPGAAPTSLLVGSSGSSAHASTSASASVGTSIPLSRSSSRSSNRSSRKGKERAVDADEVVASVPVGEMPVSVEGAREALRQIKIDPAPVNADVGDMGQSSREQAKASSTRRRRTARRYYVLTNAGKPVWCSHHGSEDANLMGIVQALISIFAEDDDRIRSIVKGRYQIAFVLKAPLYLFCVSDWGEPEHVLRTQLEYIHLQILSVVSSTQLARAFQRRSNFDPSRLLEGTESFLTSLVARCQHDFSYLTGTLQPLRMNPSLREAAAAALVPPASPAGILNLGLGSGGGGTQPGKTRVKDLLYVLLIADGHIVTLLRPRRHSIHPSDLHLLLNTLASSSTLRQGETFLPICFPKFNPAGFVHAYISYVAPEVGLVFVSADKEAYEELRLWKELVLERLIRDKTLSRIEQTLGHHTYTTAELQCPGLIHFVYKSRQLVQITSPRWPDEVQSDAEAADGEGRIPGRGGGSWAPEREVMVTMYQTLQDSLSARSGQLAGPLRLLYLRDSGDADDATDTGADADADSTAPSNVAIDAAQPIQEERTAQEEDRNRNRAAYLGWITRPFELYMCVSADLPKSAVVSAANVVAQWVASEESRLFLKDAPVF